MLRLTELTGDTEHARDRVRSVAPGGKSRAATVLPLATLSWGRRDPLLLKGKREEGPGRGFQWPQPQRLLRDSGTKGVEELGRSDGYGSLQTRAQEKALRPGPRSTSPVAPAHFEQSEKPLRGETSTRRASASQTRQPHLLLAPCTRAQGTGDSMSHFLL